jgi:hypothetical protein
MESTPVSDPATQNGVPAVGPGGSLGRADEAPTSPAAPRPADRPRRRRLTRLEVVAVVVGTLVYLSSIVDAVLYRNWTQLVAYVAQTIAVVFLLAYLHHRNRKAARPRRRPSGR